MKIETIFTYIQKYWSIAYPSIAAIFIGGFFYKRATAKGAILALIIGPIWAIAITVLESYDLIPAIPFLNRVVIDFLICWLIIWLFRNKSDEIPSHAIIDRNFSEEDEKLLKDRPWYGRFEFWSILLIVIVIALYIVFF